MSGTLAQLIALISYGNAFLLMHNPQPLTFENSAFKFCNSILFLKSEHSNNPTVVATSAQDWFDYLRYNKCKKLRLFMSRPLRKLMEFPTGNRRDL